MTTTENLIKMITGAGFDYHDYDVRTVAAYQDYLDTCRDEDPESSDYDEASIWEWLDERPTRKGSPRLPAAA